MTSEQIALFHENTDTLRHILQYVPLTEMRLGLCGVSRTWAIACLKEQSRRWKSSSITIFDNIIFDTSTGEKVHTFDEGELNDIFSERRPTIIYTKVPKEFQIIGSSTSTESDISEKVKSHSLPMTTNDIKELEFRYTNEFYIYLKDDYSIYMLFGNNLACFDFILNRMKWRVKLYTSRRPMYLFINFFFQNSKYIYIGLPNELFSFSKKDGTKFDLVTPKMMKKKERIKDIVFDNNLLIVLCGEIIISQEEFNIEKIMENAKLTNGINSKLPSNNNEDLILDKPKIFIFEPVYNNFINGITLKENDEHFIIKPKNTSVFCLTSKDSNQIRVIDENLEKIHSFDPIGKLFHQKNLFKDLENYTNTNQYFNFLVAYSFGLVDEKEGKDEDEEVDHQTYLDNTLLEFLNVENGKIYKFKIKEKGVVGFHPIIIENKLKSIVLITKSKTKKFGNGNLMKFEMTEEDEFKLVWKNEIPWKTTYIELNSKRIRFYNDTNHLYLIREYEDNRRFLSKESRLDLELKCIDVESGQELWNNQHECYFDSEVGECEKEFTLIIKEQQVVLASFVYDGFDGASFMDCYNSKNGIQLFTYSNTRRGGLKLDGKFDINYKPSKFIFNVPFKYIKSEERRTSLDLNNSENAPELRPTYSIRQETTSPSSSSTTSAQQLNQHTPISNPTQKKFQSSFSGAISSVKAKEQKDKEKCVVM